MVLSELSPSITGASFEGHYHASSKQPTDGRTFIEKLKRSIFPIRFAKAQTAAGLERIGGITEAFDQLVAAGFPQEQAAPLAFECMNGERHMNNLMSIFSILEENDGDRIVNESPSEDFVNAFIPHAQDVSDGEMQKRWAKLLLGELEAPGSFSRKAMDILSKMQREDAVAFETLCATSLFQITPNGTIGCLVPIVKASDKYGGSYNDGAMRLEDVGVLESLGILSTIYSRSFTVRPKSSILFSGDNGCIAVQNSGDSAKTISLGGLVVLRPGLELSALCQIGVAPDLENRLMKTLSGNDLEIVRINR